MLRKIYYYVIWDHGLCFIWIIFLFCGNEPREIAKNFRVLRKCSNKFDCLIFEMFFIRDLKPKLNKQRFHPRKAVCLTLLIVFLFFPLLIYTSFSHYFYFYCWYVNTCFLLFIPLFQKLYIPVCGIVLSMNLNLKMAVERSKHRSYFLSLVFITKCSTKKLLLLIFFFTD